MAKKDLKEATRAATAGMFTAHAKKDASESVETQNQNHNIKAMDEIDIISGKKASSATQRTKKPASDYLYLDLRPTGDVDLKRYVMEQAHRTSVEQGRNISATNYIQNLIKKDMVSKANDTTTTRTRIISLLDNATDEKIEAIYTIVKNII